MSLPRCALVILSKPPLIGKVKTRLTPQYSFDQAALFHQSCIQQVWSNLKQLQNQTSSLYTINRFLSISQSHPLWSTLLTKEDEALFIQPNLDLGGRMAHAFQHCFDQIIPLPSQNTPHALQHPLSSLDHSHYDQVILFGTDSPTLPLHYIEMAIEKLNQASQLNQKKCVFGPACDGGYYLIGINSLFYDHFPLQETLFNQIEWSTPTVLSQTLAHLLPLRNRAEISIDLLPFWYDVDTAYDLEFMRSHLPILTQSPPQDFALFTSDVNQIFSSSKDMSPHSQVEISPSQLDQLRRPFLLPKDPQDQIDYTQALKIIFDLTRFGERMDLETPKELNRLLGDPLSSYQNILIGGTNGKGTTAAYVNTLGQASGYRVGRFNSPHLISFRERISINGVLIAHTDVIQGVNTIIGLAKQHHIKVSFFEATWALAAWYFKQQKVDYVIWEVGLGGRLDATNVCTPCVSAITTIGLDHTHLLGDTHQQIAYEKGAIFRDNQPALTSATGKGKDALCQYAKQRQLDHLQFVDMPPLPKSEFSSHFQAQNAALAWGIHQALNWNASPEVLKTTQWPGRLEKIEDIWLDCAHNPQAIQALLPWIQDQLKLNPRPVHLIFGASQDKEIITMINLLTPYIDHITWVSPQYPRCAKGDDLATIYSNQTQGWTSQVIDSVKEALSQTNPKALTLVTGSCFLVGEARAYLLNLPFPEANLLTTAR